jgi:hypothetical protein
MTDDHPQSSFACFTEWMKLFPPSLCFVLCFFNVQAFNAWQNSTVKIIRARRFLVWEFGNYKLDFLNSYRTLGMTYFRLSESLQNVCFKYISSKLSNLARCRVFLMFPYIRLVATRSPCAILILITYVCSFSLVLLESCLLYWCFQRSIPLFHW